MADETSRSEFPLDWVLFIVCVASLGVGLATDVEPLRIAGALPLIMFWPGYFLLLALYPEARRVAPPGGEASGLRRAERAAYATATSLVLAFFAGMALQASSYNIRETSTLVALVGLNLLLGLVGGARWAGVDRERRWSCSMIPQTGGRPRLAPWLLASVFIAATGVLVYFMADPGNEEHYTTAYLLDVDGKKDCFPNAFGAAGYFNEINVSGSKRPNARCDDVLPITNVTLGLVNHEGKDQTYRVRVLWARLVSNLTEEVVVEQVQEFRTVVLGKGVEASERRTIVDLPQPPEDRSRLRLVFLIDQDGPMEPLTPGQRLPSAYRMLRLVISASS